MLNFILKQISELEDITYHTESKEKSDIKKYLNLILFMRLFHV